MGPPPGAPPPAPVAPPAAMPPMPPPQGYFQSSAPVAAPLLGNPQQAQMVPTGAFTLATQPPPVTGRQRIQGSTMVAITK